MHKKVASVMKSRFEDRTKDAWHNTCSKVKKKLLRGEMLAHASTVKASGSMFGDASVTIGNNTVSAHRRFSLRVRGGNRPP